MFEAAEESENEERAKMSNVLQSLMCAQQHQHLLNWVVFCLFRTNKGLGQTERGPEILVIVSSHFLRTFAHFGLLEHRGRIAIAFEA